jgi:hypothetical protein
METLSNCNKTTPSKSAKESESGGKLTLKQRLALADLRAAAHGPTRPAVPASPYRPGTTLVRTPGPRDPDWRPPCLRPP